MWLSKLFGFNDREFYKKLLKLSLPIILQQSLASGVYFVDNIMIGMLGESEIAAVGVANQLAMLFFMSLIGITSSGGIFAAQLWGKKDVPEIKRIQGIVLLLSIVFALGAAAVGFFFPRQFLGLFSKDPAVIEIGAMYLKIAVFGYLAQAVSFSFAAILRSCGVVLLPVIASSIAVLTNVFLNYVFIFGKLGVAAMGVRGAALATVIAVALEMIIVITFCYMKKYPAASSFKELRDYHKGLFTHYVKICWPVFLNEAGWAIGIATYSMMFGKLGTQTVAAFQIYNTIDRIAFVVLIAISTTSAIMVGNLIGEHRVQDAKIYAKRFIALMAVAAFIIGVVVIVLGPMVAGLYNISQETKSIASGIIMAYGSLLWINGLVFVNIVGILRSGGDTAFATASELLPMWLINIPLFYFFGVVLRFPIWQAYALTFVGDIVKLIVSFRRFRSDKWIKDITKVPEVV